MFETIFATTYNIVYILPTIVADIQPTRCRIAFVWLKFIFELRYNEKENDNSNRNAGVCHM